MIALILKLKRHVYGKTKIKIFANAEKKSWKNNERGGGTFLGKNFLFLLIGKSSHLSLENK